jgi:hypothetical protein
MRDLIVHDDDLIVATHGRSFWVLDNITPLRQVTAATQSADAFLFKPAAAYRVRRSTNTDTPIPPDEPTGKNTPDGAVVDFFLSHDASGPVTLEILDARNKVVRRYASTDKPDLSEEDLAKQLIPLYWVRKPKVLSASAGMHRWVWDLHYSTPNSPRYNYPISAVPGDTPRVPQGPLALPGQYTVKLTVNGHSYSEPLTVKRDPRVKTPDEGLAQMFQMETRLASMMTDNTRALAEARSARDQLQKLAGQANGPVADAIAALQKKLAAVLGGGEGPRGGGSVTTPTITGISGAIGALYGEVDRADATPTSAQQNAMTETEKGFADVKKQWVALKETDLQALNQQLRKANLPEVRLESSAPEEDESQDIE